MAGMPTVDEEGPEKDEGKPKMARRGGIDQFQGVVSGFECDRVSRIGSRNTTDPNTNLVVKV